jgi:hypothetical protein
MAGRGAGSRCESHFGVDVINVPNRTTLNNPNLNPTSTDFGRILTASSATPHPVRRQMTF